jgi:hypothetical protein
MGSLPDRKRFLLAALALVAGGFVPIQLVTLSFGYAQYFKGVGMGPRTFAVAHEFAAIYIPFVYVPAMVVLLIIGIYGRNHYPDLTRRIVVGFSMGVIATLGLDAVRQSGVINGWLPGDTPIMFGKMATGSPDFIKIYSAGLLVHYLNGANFGLVYAFVWGKRRSYRSAAIWATFWALLLELGMMTGPPMAKMVGMFGYNWAWPQLFVLTFVAHIVFGIALGLLIQHFLREEDSAWLWPFLKGQRDESRVAPG